LVCVAVIVFQQAAQHSSALSDAGNWAAIIAAGILVVGSVFGWFHRISHALHVVGEKVAINVDESVATHILEVGPALDLFNSSGIPLSFEVTSLKFSVGEHEERDGTEGGSPTYIAPQQKYEWNVDAPESLHFDEFPVEVVARYEIQYGRKSRIWQWWRRALRGSFKVKLPLSAEPMTLLSQHVEGPATDTRVPLTKVSIFGWRL
jgi:hypothetical protein